MVTVKELIRHLQTLPPDMIFRVEVTDHTDYKYLKDIELTDLSVEDDYTCDIMDDNIGYEQFKNEYTKDDLKPFVLLNIGQI
jgi:hypothetical protein